MALLTQAQFKAQNPNGNWNNYISYVAKNGSGAAQQAARAVQNGMSAAQANAKFFQGAKPAGSSGGGGGGGGSSSGGGGGGKSNVGPGSMGQFGGPGNSPDGLSSAKGVPDWVFHASSSEIMNDPAKAQWLLNYAGIPGATLDEKLKNAMLGYSFAGVQQYQANQSGEGGRQYVRDNPALQNVSLDTDVNALSRILNEIQGSIQEGRGNIKQIWADRLKQGSASSPSGVADWAGGVFDTLMNGKNVYQSILDTGKSKSNMGFTLEDLASPGINLYDPSQPLFASGYHPPSLLGYTGFGAGEEGFYRGLNAPEFLTGPWQAGNAYYNRGAGQPASGPSPLFGDMQYNPGLSGNFMNDPNGLFTQSPIRSSPLYERWQAYGMPGDPTQNGTVNVGSPWLKGATINPLTGEINQGQGQGLIGLMQSGAVRPEYFANGMNEFMGILNDYLSPVGMSAFTGDPSYYWSMPYTSPYAPGQVGQDTLARLLAVAQGAMQTDTGQE